ncbi:MAG: hypothetical protein NTW97_02455, partial [Candidatus Krumholzibacteria bacterium]|nr:hypothetical protein [Candidatus Krumholzibacteria bacterium]
WKLEYFEGTGKKENICGKSIEEKKTGRFAYSMRGVFNVERWMVLVQRHPVTPGYRLSFAAEMRGKNLQKNRGQQDRANIYVRFYDKNGKRVNERYYADGYTRTLYGTSDWRRIGRRVDIPKNAHYVDIGLICQMTGWVYFDDVELVVEAPIPWKEIKTKYVNYYYLEGSPFPPGAIDKETAFIEGCVKKLDLEIENRISYYYYPSEAKFQEIIGVRKGHERAMWKKQELHTTKTYDDHEMIHMLLVPLGYPPFGIVEGLVFYVLGSWEGRDLHMVAKQSLMGMRLPALYKVFTQQDMDAAGMSTVVPGWASFSIWLIDRRGIDKFMKLYKETNEVEDPAVFAAHFKSVYGKEFEETDREWRLWVLRYQPRK